MERRRPKQLAIEDSPARRTEDAREQAFAQNAAMLRRRLTQTLEAARAAVRATHEILGQTRARRARRETGSGEPAQAVMRRAVNDSERAITLHDQFVALVAHEMRQPLQAAAAAVRLIEVDAPPAARGCAMKVLKRQIERLSGLVEDLLDSARLAARGVELYTQRLDLGTLMAHVVREVRYRMDVSRHELVTQAPDGPVPFVGDAFRLREVFVNLLDNAARYTPPGGRIWFEGRDLGETIELKVRDTGPGIPLEVQPHLFDIFVRGGLSGDGAGVGLAVARELVALHHGRISLTSHPGAGAEFVVTLPAAGPREDGQAPI